MLATANIWLRRTQIHTTADSYEHSLFSTESRIVSQVPVACQRSGRCITITLRFGRQ
jgi:hypothetical protein